MKAAESINDLSREDLLKLNTIYAKNWLAHDGLWFQAIEEKFDMDIAIEMDRESLAALHSDRGQAPDRIFGAGENSGIDGLRKSLPFGCMVH